MSTDADNTSPLKKEEPPKKPSRRYTYKGRVPKRPQFLDYGNGVRIMPWSMTDDQVDKLKTKRPDLVEKYFKS